MSQLDKSQIAEIIIYLYLTGTNSINQECEPVYSKTESYQRDIMFKFMKLVLDKNSNEYSIAFGIIEECIENLHSEELMCNTDFELIQNLSVKDMANYDIGSFLIKSKKDKMHIIDKCNEFIY